MTWVNFKGVKRLGANWQGGETTYIRAKYGTYTMLDAETDLVVDFKVISMCEVKNSNAMEKKGFIETLNSIEAAGVDVAGISTDSHPQMEESAGGGNQTYSSRSQPQCFKRTGMIYYMIY